MTNEERIELCLKRLSMGKTSDVMNFSYADALDKLGERQTKYKNRGAQQ